MFEPAKSAEPPIKAQSTLVKEVRIIIGEELEKLGMNLFYGVGKAYVNAPRMVLIHY